MSTFIVVLLILIFRKPLLVDLRNLIHWLLKEEE
jgi:hypothetical protein